MRTITTSILAFVLALGLALVACAEKTPPPRSAESEARDAPAAMAVADPSEEGKNPETRPAPEKGTAGDAQPEMTPPKPEAGDTGTTDKP